jgi:hypothetical protein
MTSRGEQTLQWARRGMLLWMGTVVIFIVVVIWAARPERRTVLNVGPSVLLNAGILALGLRATRKLKAGDLRLAQGLLIGYGICAVCAIGLIVGLAHFDGGVAVLLAGGVLAAGYAVAVAALWAASTKPSQQES